MSARGKDERERIAAKIRGLLSKTVESGCTEAEALAAAALAADLLARHDMDLDEAELRATPFDEQTHSEADAVGHRIWRVASAIAELTHCRYWRTGPGINPVQITFLGLEHEVEIAGYLLAICARAMRDESSRVEREVAILRPEFRRRKINAFLDGMSETLGRRIRAMIPPRVTGTGLVVVRDALVEAEMERRGHELEDMRAPRGLDLEDGYDAGREAAERVALDRGLEGPERDRARISGRG